MIFRNLAVRYGRKAAVASGSRTSLRCVSLTPQSTSILEPPPAPVGGSDAPFLSLSAPKVSPETLAKRRAKAAEKKAIRRIPREYAKYVAIKRMTNDLGSQQHVPYDPNQLYNGEGIPEQPTLELLMASQAHMGHNTSLWNPHNSRYIYGVRAGIHIISLETTLAHLRRAALVVEQVALHGGLILFVGTRRGQMPIVVSAAERAGACHLFSKWTPGTITNRESILGGMKMKVVDEKDEVLVGFNPFLLDNRPLVPDLVVCLNPLENYTMLYECGLANVPTIGIIDTDADPTWVTYQIPANDDSLRAVAVIANVLGRAGGRGQAKRKALAAGGQTTWHNPNDVEIFIEKEAREKLVDKLGKAKAAANGKVMHGGGEGEEKEGLSEEDAFFKAMLEGNDEGGSDFDDSDEDSDEDSDSDSDSDSDED